MRDLPRQPGQRPLRRGSVANPDAEQCPAEVAPYEGGKYPNLVGQRYRCVRDAGHPADSFPDRHIGVRSDGGVDYSG